MNMILHNKPTALIMQGNTLADPQFKDSHSSGSLKTFDYVVANPPFSDKRWSTGVNPANDPFERFQTFGTPPDKQGDYAYLLHIVRSLKSTGKGACILPHGVLFRGGAEGTIRRNLVRKGYILGLIGLPANLFYGTGIPACIIVLDKQDAAARKGIFMLDASSGYTKDGPKNRLRDRDNHKIVDVFTKRLDPASNASNASATNDANYARMVSLDEIERNDYNLNLPRYLNSQTPEDPQDLGAHLQGGIPSADIAALHAYWAVCPQLRQSLLHTQRPGYLQLTAAPAHIQSSVHSHPEFASFIRSMNSHYSQWQSRSAASLKTLGQGCQPKKIITELAEDLLTHYRGQPLMDAYAVYQHLMDYWASTMQDDAYLIAADGWQARPHRILEKDKAGREKDKGWACDLVPKALLIAQHFAAEQAAIDATSAQLEQTSSQLSELEEEHSGDDAIFSGYDKINKASVQERLQEISNYPKAEAQEAADETRTLRTWLQLSSSEAALKKQLKPQDTALDAKAYAHYPQLTPAQITTLVVDHKWLATLNAAIHSEMDRISQTLTQRITELTERYAAPLPALSQRSSELEANVTRHLAAMGVVGD